MPVSTNSGALLEYAQHLFAARSHETDIQRDPIVVRESKGIAVRDVKGREYLDGLSGIWVVNIGHGNQSVVDAMITQLRSFSFSWPEGTLNEPAIRLARLLADITPAPLTTVKLLNSGSEATEAAMKLARQYFFHTGHPRKTKIISRYLSWHGSTMGALSMGGTTGWKEPFGPFLGECRHVPPHYCYRCPYGLTYSACDVACARVIENVLEWEDPETVAAVIVDPVMVSAGILVPPMEYLQVLREICDRTNTLLIFDEVITGFGRTGKMFAMDTFDVVPDIVAMAKGMSSGYAPLAGIIASQTVAEAFSAEEKPFEHGHTFGGNPVSAAAGVANITEMLKHNLIENAGAVGAYLQEQGRSFHTFPIVGDVRGVGMILGIEFVADRDTRAPFPGRTAPGLRVQAACQKRGLLIRANPHWMALAPPLITTELEIDKMLEIIADSIREVQTRILSQ
jgi:adenosylmethionine-8-amino-7-oxononanoate aminotransferase